MSTSGENPVVQGPVGGTVITALDGEIRPCIRETEVLSLSIDRRHDAVLIDEASVRSVARLEGLRPRGTLSFLFRALQNGDSPFDEFIDHMETFLFTEGFYPDEAVYLKAVRKAWQLADEGDPRIVEPCTGGRLEQSR